jgi:hypothetical protein
VEVWESWGRARGERPGLHGACSTSLRRLDCLGLSLWPYVLSVSGLVTTAPDTILIVVKAEGQTQDRTQKTTHPCFNLQQGTSPSTQPGSHQSSRPSHPIPSHLVAPHRQPCKRANPRSATQRFPTQRQPRRVSVWDGRWDVTLPHAPSAAAGRKVLANDKAPVTCTTVCLCVWELGSVETCATEARRRQR